MYELSAHEKRRQKPPFFNTSYALVPDMKNTYSNNFGFSLVEMAIVLVIVGLLLGVGTTMIGPMTKLAKTRETRDSIDSSAAAILSFAATNGRIPGRSTPVPATYLEFETVASRYTDAFGNPVVYFWEPNLANSPNSICGQSTTNLVVCRDTACSIGAGRVTNVVYVMASGGANLNPQVGIITCPTGLPGTTICIGAYDPGTVNTASPSGFDNCTDTGNCPAANVPPAPQLFNRINRPEEYDDVVKWVTLYEMKSRVGCIGYQGGYRVWNNSGVARDFMLSGKCIGPIPHNTEITLSTGVTTAGQITAYTSTAGTCTGPVTTVTYAQIQTADGTGGDGCINFNTTGPPTDRNCP
jgi:prepilin-type N-terminal cleavage/methylation domain-containing protein